LKIAKANYKGSNAEKAWNTPPLYDLKIHRKDRSFYGPKLQDKEYGKKFFILHILGDDEIDLGKV
jgi:hypothetical protein